MDKFQGCMVSSVFNPNLQFLLYNFGGEALFPIRRDSVNACYCYGLLLLWPAVAMFRKKLNNQLPLEKKWGCKRGPATNIRGL